MSGPRTTTAGARAFAGVVDLDDLAQVQYGLLARAQLLEAVSEWQMKMEVRSGRLVRVHRGVYRLVGVPPSYRQRVLAGCLAAGPGSVASHTSAARLHGLDGIAAAGAEVTVSPAHSGRIPGVVVHRCVVGPEDSELRYAIPVTTPARTLIDIAGDLSDGALQRAVSDAFARRLVSHGGLGAALDSALGGRRKGRARLRELVERHCDGVAPGSVWEDRVHGWLVDAGLPRPVRQYQVVLNSVVRLVDLAYPDAMVAVEFNGFEYHGRRARFDVDQERVTELQLAGWIVVLITSATDPALAVDKVRRALRSRGAL